MTHIFGLIAFLVLLVSVSSVFVESAYADEADAIAVILGITFENIQESFTDAGIDPEGDPVFVAAHEEYLEALAALDAGDIVIAEASALQAMALFEKSAENIGELEDQTSTQFPSGLGTAAASIFNVQEGITNSVNEAGELHKLIQSNDLDIDLGEFDEYVNLAKTLLADGVFPDAQAQLDLANQIKTELYAEIQDAANNISVSGIKDALDDQENLGLTKKEIRELEEMAEELSTEYSNASGNSDDASGQSEENAPGNSGDASGQNKDNGGDDSPGNSGDASGQNKEDSPGNSGDAPGQNKDAGDNPSAEGVADGIGLGLGGENIPPGQLKKIGYSLGYDQSPDDYYENHYESQIDDTYEDAYDGTNRGYGDGKGKYGSHPGKDNADAPTSKAVGNTKGGNPNCTNEGITDGDSENTSGEVGVDYTIQGISAIGSSCNDATASLIINVFSPGIPPLFAAKVTQPFTFQPDEAGTWTIAIIAEGFFENRIVNVIAAGGIVADAGEDQPDILEGQDVTLDGSGSTDDVGIVSYTWVQTSGFGSPTITNSAAPPEFSAEVTNIPTTGPPTKVYVFTLTVFDIDGNSDSDSVTVTVSEP